MSSAPAVGALILLLFLSFWLSAFLFWIFKLVEVARLPDQQFRAAGSDKTTWVLVVVLAGLVGALIWQFAKRSAVLRAAGVALPPPPGWYPEPGTGVLRWWDGYRWTEHRQGGPPAPWRP